MERYDYWTHTRSGENYLVRFDGTGVVTGVCGPMQQSQIPAANRHNFDYDSQPEHAEWLRLHLAEFHSLAPGSPAPVGAAGVAQAQAN
jgi:hypothetical protein